MPLQSATFTSRIPHSITFSPLNRGNASTITTIEVYHLEYCQLSVPSTGAMPLQYSTLAHVDAAHLRLSVPSTGAMPLQLDLERPQQRQRAQVFQSPQPGQCLYNWQWLRGRFRGLHDFQSPQPGQCLYNPTVRPMPRIADKPFSPLNRGNASTMSVHCWRNSGRVDFQSPQPGQCLYNFGIAALDSVNHATFSPLNRGNASTINCAIMEP